jgi:hypothetical protein
MKSDEVTVTLFAIHTAEGMARACRDYAKNGWPRCPVGWHFQCPLVRFGDGRCAKVNAKDWEAVMQEVQDDPQ